MSLSNLAKDGAAHVGGPLSILIAAGVCCLTLLVLVAIFLIRKQILIPQLNWAAAWVRYGVSEDDQKISTLQAKNAHLLHWLWRLVVPLTIVFVAWALFL
jgi:hypothetical protein